MLIGGSGVVSDAYKRFEIFKDFESRNELQNLKQSTTDSMLKIDLEAFENSGQFLNYIEENENYCTALTSVFISLIYATAIEVCIYLTLVIGFCRKNFEKA